MDEQMWQLIYRVADFVSNGSGDEDAALEIGLRVAETVANGGDLLNDGIWGSSPKDGRVGFRYAQRAVLRNGWNESPVVLDDDGEIVGFDSETSDTPWMFDLDDKRLVKRWMSNLDLSDEDERGTYLTLAQVLEGPTELTSGGEEADEYVSLPKSDPFADRIREMYSDVKEGDAAVAASSVDAGGHDILAEATSHELMVEDFLSAEVERVPVYLQPEYELDDELVRAVLRRVGYNGFEWLTAKAETDRDLYFEGLRRIAQLSRGLNPVEKAAVCAGLVSEWTMGSEDARDDLADAMAEGKVSRVLIEEPRSFSAPSNWGVTTTFGEYETDLVPELDLDDEDVQWQLGIADWVNEIDEFDPILEAGDADAIEEYVRLIDSRVDPSNESWKFWDVAEARQEFARVSLTTRCTWKAGAAAGREAAKKSPGYRQAWAQFHSAKRERENLPTQELRTTRRPLAVRDLQSWGVTDGDGKSARWSEIVEGSVKLSFAAGRLAPFIAAVKANISNPLAQQAVALL